jgi:hypothetical protein
MTKSTPSAIYLPLASLKLWDKNPRQNDHAVEALARLLALNTQRTPIVAWTQNSTIYKGNTTYKAMALLHKKGLDSFISAADREKIWKAIRHTPDPADRVAANEHRNKFETAVSCGDIWCVLQSFPSEAAAIAYAISDNKASEFSDWDDIVLSGLQQAYHFEAPVIGFSPKELATLEANLGSFAAQTYDQMAEAFEKQKVGKKEVLWFWFEVDGKAALEFIKAKYARSSERGKRLHRELDWELLAPVLGWGAKIARLPARKVLRMKEAGK